MITRVVITSGAAKDLKSVPVQVAKKLRLRIDAVEAFGLESVRKVPGYHDEPLKGQRVGQRSIRLNQAFRAIYSVGNDGTARFVAVKEVNKHRY